MQPTEPAADDDYARQARALSRLLHHVASRVLDAADQAWLQIIVERVEDAVDARDAVALRAARGDLVALSDRRLTGLGEPSAVPPVALAPERISRLVHRLTDDAGEDRVPESSPGRPVPRRRP